MTLSGQQNKPEKAKPEEAKMATVEDDQVDMNLINPGEFIYKPEGRRDPFVSWLQGQKKRVKTDLTGISSLDIDQIILEGISKFKGGYFAMIKGPDSKPYIIKVGDKVYDGEVIHIDKYSIQFKKTMSMVFVGQKEKIVTLSVNPDEEGVSKNEKN
jgi:hypothetical protein